MPRIRVDASPWVAEFNDSSPLTEGLSNFLSALLMAPQVRAQLEEQRRVTDMQSARADRQEVANAKRGVLAERADKRAQEKHDLAMKQANSGKPQQVDLGKAIKNYKSLYPQPQPPDPDDPRFKDDLGELDRQKYMDAYRNYQHDAHNYQQALEHLAENGERVNPSDWAKRNKAPEYPDAAGNAMAPFAEKVAEGVTRAKQMPGLDQLLGRLGLGGGQPAAPNGQQPPAAQPRTGGMAKAIGRAMANPMAVLPEVTDGSRSPTAKQAGPEAEPSGTPEEVTDGSRHRTAKPAAPSFEPSGTAEDVTAYLRGERPPKQPDDIQGMVDGAKMIVALQAEANAPRQLGEMLNMDYRTATPETKRFLDRMGPLFVKAKRGEQAALADLKALLESEDGPYIRTLMQAWNKRGS